MSRVTVYSTANCSFCKLTKDKLAQWNIPFDEVRIDLDAAALEDLVGRNFEEI